MVMLKRFEFDLDTMLKVKVGALRAIIPNCTAEC